MPLGSIYITVSQLHPIAHSPILINVRVIVATDVCRDLVLYDVPKHNPFRELIPLTHQHPILLQVIIANSALHMSNVCQRSLVSDTTPVSFRQRTSLLVSPCSSSSTMKNLESYNDALAAKQRALYLLKSALSSIYSVGIDVTLAVVLLFIELELIDSGRDSWRYHINGARTIIDTLCRSNTSTQTAMTPLRSFLISNCLVYAGLLHSTYPLGHADLTNTRFDILGSTLASSIGLAPSDTFSTSSLSLLQDAEGNHCSSFPASLLQLIRNGARLSHSNSPFSATALHLLHTAQSFDPLTWATDLQQRSPVTDLLQRTHVASAHRAAVCIYLSRVLLSMNPTLQLGQKLETLVEEIVTHSSPIHPSDALFTATTWPAFIAGAETNDPTKQEWVTRRFQELWEVEPWGLIRGALGVLERIWAGRRSEVMDDGEGALVEGKEVDGDWIGLLRDGGVDWLIL